MTEQTPDALAERVAGLVREYGDARSIAGHIGYANASHVAADIIAVVRAAQPGRDLTDVAAAVTEAYRPAGQATWWRSWARNPDRRAQAEAGVLAAWSGHDDHQDQP